MYQLMINRKNSKKGFTLVEVIVVLVILAILAAIMVPAMTGWIDKARERAVVVEARNVLLAAQATISERYGVSGSSTPIDAWTDADATAAAKIANVTADQIKTVAVANNVITGLTFTNTAGKTATYSVTNGVGKWEVS